MRDSRLFHALGMLLLFFAFTALCGWFVMALWNWLLPSICNFAAVSFWQACGLVLLGTSMSGFIILPLLGIGHGLRGDHNRNHKELRDKWTRMTAEQRRQFLASRGFLKDDEI